MILISNTNYNLDGQTGYYNIDEFIRLVNDEDGFNIDDQEYLLINIDDIDQDLYESLTEFDIARFFSDNGNNPSWNHSNLENINVGRNDGFVDETVSDGTNSVSIEFVNDPITITNTNNTNTNSSVNMNTTEYTNNYGGYNGISNSGSVNTNVNPITYNENTILEIQNSLTELFNKNEDEFSNNSVNDSDTSAIVYTFGSSKGGTGKTLTTIMSTYRFAKLNPDKRICLLDFDIIDGQVGISIHKVSPTLKKFYIDYQQGRQDFNAMSMYAIKGNGSFPKNVDFYLAPSGKPIKDDEFWFNVLDLVVKNYDVVCIDCGIDYLNIAPISYAYKIADKISIVTTTSIKSVNSIKNQILNLKGAKENYVFTKEDNLADKINIVITQVSNDNPEINQFAISKIRELANVEAIFGVITNITQNIEYFERYEILDSNPEICNGLDNIMKL